MKDIKLYACLCDEHIELFVIDLWLDWEILLTKPFDLDNSILIFQVFYFGSWQHDVVEVYIFDWGYIFNLLISIAVKTDTFSVRLIWTVWQSNVCIDLDPITITSSRTQCVNVWRDTSDYCCDYWRLKQWDMKEW